MNSGLVIYVASIDRMVSFYSDVFGFEFVEKDNSHAVLLLQGFELVLLETPTAKHFSLLVEPRENTSLKPVFFVDTPLEVLSERIKEKSGATFPQKTWHFKGHQVCDAYDCEGNIFQLRIRVDE